MHSWTVEVLYMYNMCMHTRICHYFEFFQGNNVENKLECLVYKSQPGGRWEEDST